MLWFGYKNPENFKDLGPWGDFFGGTLNPIFTFITVLGLLLTVALQRQELSLTRKELERSADALESQSDQINAQKFESTLFQMLSMLNEIVDSIEYDNRNTGRTLKGRDALNYLYFTLGEKYATMHYYKSTYKNKEKLSEFIEEFTKENSNKISHYFRYLSSIFKLIDNSNYSNKQHSNIVRSQLSNQEILLLFYNSLTEEGKNFQIIAQKHELFDDLPIEKLLHSHHKQYLSDAARENENAAV